MTDQIPPLPPGATALPPLPPGATLLPDNLDRRGGAPASVRAAVGSATRPEDRLATIQRTYPDARPYGADNFVFTNPRTGRPTLYNPPGLDWGDAASVIPEMGEFLGGTAGAAAAGLAAAPTGGMSLATVPAAVGLGAAAGREIGTLAGQYLGNTVDRRGPLERTVDAAQTAGVNAVALPAADLVARGARAVGGAVSRAMGPRTGPAAVQDFLQAGVTPSAGAVTGNRGVQLFEATLEASPGGAAPMQAMREGQAQQLGGAVERTAQQLGRRADPADVGGIVREGAANAADRFTARQEQLYNRAYNMVGAGTPAPVAAVQRLQGEIAAELAQAPEARAGVLGPVLQRVERILADAQANGGAVPFETLRAIRTDLGRELNPRNPAQAVPSATVQYLERLYGSLSEDMLGAARAVSPQAENAIRLADRYTRMQRTQNLPALEKVLAQGTDEQVYRLVFPQNGRPDPQALARLRRNLSPEEWGAVSATVLDRMGMPTAGVAAGETFSVNTFLTNWNRLNQNGPGARNVLFGGPNAQLAGELDNLVRVAQRLRDANSMRNWSGTARVAGMGAGALAAGQDVTEGDWKGLATLGALGIVAPRYAAQMMTNPATVRWLAGATQVSARNGVIPDSQWGRLAAVGEANPELRDAIQNFRITFNQQAPRPATQAPAALPR